MTYLGSETSQHDGKPTELYRFSGTYANFYYTSGQKKITYQAPDDDVPHDYIPIAMRRSEINCGTQDDDGLDLTIEMAVTNELVQVYGFQQSPPTLDLVMFRFHTLADVVAYWTGPVNDIQVANGVATIRSPSTLSAALAANIPNFYFQSPCNNVLFDKRCKVYEADWTDAAEVLALDGRAITVDSVGTLAGKLLGGEVRLASGERRMITAEGPIVIPVPGPDPDINAYQLIVNFPFTQLAEGDSVDVTAGCDLSYTGDCRVKFNNNRNFGGFPFIPAANPFQDGIDPSVVPLADATCLPEPFSDAYLTCAFTAPNPCNAEWSGLRSVSINEVQPNGPGGKSIGLVNFPFNAAPGVQEVFENTVPGNPLLQGQLLFRLTANDWNDCYIVFFFPCVFNSAYMKPSARYCGSVGKDEGTVSLSVTYAEGSFTIYGPYPAGGNYDIYFPQ